MKKLNVIAAFAFFMLIWLAVPSNVPAQKNPKFDYPTLERQLTQEYHGEKVRPGSELHPARGAGSVYGGVRAIRRATITTSTRPRAIRSCSKRSLNG